MSKKNGKASSLTHHTEAGIEMRSTHNTRSDRSDAESLLLHDQSEMRQMRRQLGGAAVGSPKSSFLSVIRRSTKE